MPGKHKKAVDVQGTSHLLLIRDETGPPDSQVRFKTCVNKMLDHNNP